MKVFNHASGKKENHTRLIYGLVYIDKNYAEFGYFSFNPNSVLAYLPNDRQVWAIDVNILIENNFIYDNRYGVYTSPSTLPNDEEGKHGIFRKGNGDYPYLINKEYAAKKSFDIFYGKQQFKEEPKIYQFSSAIPYSFGLEFETSMGYIPQPDCFKDGLIPLRDGSISGIEYSTVVHYGNPGLQLLEQSLKDLNEYTEFNKECALHIHFGGYPVNEISIFTLHKVFEIIQYSLSRYIPDYSFSTSKYKNNGKDYCIAIPKFNTFKEMYNYYSGGSPYLGCLTQPHPDDIDRERKWNIHSRYHNINIINMLFYDSAKTVEFRFLRPTYSFEKISLWLMIFSSILKYSQTLAESFKTICECELHFKNLEIMDKAEMFNKAIDTQNTKENINLIYSGLGKLAIVKSMQSSNGDYCGRDIAIENKVFKY